MKDIALRFPAPFEAIIRGNIKELLRWPYHAAHAGLVVIGGTLSPKGKNGSSQFTGISDGVSSLDVAIIDGLSKLDFSPNCALFLSAKGKLNEDALIQKVRLCISFYKALSPFAIQLQVPRAERGGCTTLIDFMDYYHGYILK